MVSSLSGIARMELQRNTEEGMLLNLGPVESLGPRLCDTLCTSVVSPLSVTSRIEPQRNTEERRGGMLLNLGPAEFWVLTSVILCVPLWFPPVH